MNYITHNDWPIAQPCRRRGRGGRSRQKERTCPPCSPLTRSRSRQILKSLYSCGFGEKKKKLVSPPAPPCYSTWLDHTHLDTSIERKHWQHALGVGSLLRLSFSVPLLLLSLYVALSFTLSLYVSLPLSLCLSESLYQSYPSPRSLQFSLSSSHSHISK